MSDEGKDVIKLKNREPFKPTNIETYSHLALDTHAGPIKPKHHDDTDTLEMSIGQIEKSNFLNRGKNQLNKPER